MAVPAAPMLLLLHKQSHYHLDLALKHVQEPSCLVIVTCSTYIIIATAYNIIQESNVSKHVHMYMWACSLYCRHA